MVTLYTSSPPPDRQTTGAAAEGLLGAARESEKAGFHGMLIHSDNRSLEPWSTTQLVIANTRRLVPLVALNPVYMHPLTAARVISTIGLLYGRSVDLNLVSGGFARHLRELGCEADHDERYRRLAEYGVLLRRLLTERRPVTHDGPYYHVRSASLNPRPDPDLLPRILMSGASPAARRVQRELGATRLAYPLAAGVAVDGDADALRDTGIGLGILARPDAEAAWAVAHQRFPHDEMGEEMHDWSAREVESHWHINLSRAATRTQSAEKTYWLYPFRSSRTFCPYLVGSYADVAHVLRGYFDRGVTAIVLDGLMRPEDLPHLRVALGQAGADEAHVAGQPSGGAEVHVE